MIKNASIMDQMDHLKKALKLVDLHFCEESMSDRQGFRVRKIVGTIDILVPINIAKSKPSNLRSVPPLKQELSASGTSSPTMGKNPTRDRHFHHSVNVTILLSHFSRLAFSH